MKIYKFYFCFFYVFSLAATEDFEEKIIVYESDSEGLPLGEEVIANLEIDLLSDAEELVFGED